MERLNAASARDRLRKAHRERDHARGKLAKAAEAEARADDLFQEAAETLAGRTRACEEVEETAAAELAQRLKDGKVGAEAARTNRATDSGERRLLKARAEAASATAAAALRQLAGERVAAEQDVAAAEGEVASAAMAVIIAEAEQIAIELAEARAKTWGLEAQLHGVARLWSGAGPMQLSRAAVEVLTNREAPATAARFSPERLWTAKWREFHIRLLVSADASLEELEAAEATQEVELKIASGQ